MIKKPKTITKRFVNDTSKGQHLLKSDAIAKRIVNVAHIHEHETVLEIGPGTGNITILLAQKAKLVYAYEIDKKMCRELRRRLTELELIDKVKIINKNFLKANLPKFDHCVSNIPYQISSKIVFKLLKPVNEGGVPFKSAVIMFQKEFAERLAAKCYDKNYSKLSACTQLLSKTQFLFQVERKYFSPPPMVDSGVVKFEPKRIDHKFYLPTDVQIKEEDRLKLLNEFIKKFTFVCNLLFLRKNRSVRGVLNNSNSLNALKTQGICIGKELLFEELSKIEFEFKKKKETKIIPLTEARTRMLSVVDIVNLVKFFDKYGLCIKGNVDELLKDENSDDEGDEVFFE